MVAPIGLNSTPMIESQHVGNMDTPEYRCYANNNNNNYIPGLPQPVPYFQSPVTQEQPLPYFPSPITQTQSVPYFPSSITQTQSVPYFPSPVTVHASCMPAMPSSIYQNGQMGQTVNTSFTFTNPTQGNVISHTMPLYTAPMSAIPCLPQQSRIVPGIGAQWQHTVPQNMPWAVASQGSSHVTEFTAQSSVPYHMVPPFMTRSEPKASCSFTQRRPKRHFTESDEELAPITKLHVTDDMMMARMQGLHITAPNSSGNTPATLQQASWRKFRDLEQRLEDDSGYCSVGNSGTTSTVRARLPRLRLKAGIDPQDLLKPSPILPKTILNDLNKPCMEIVLWKPPGIVRNIEDILSHKPDELQTGRSEDRSLPSRTLQQTVTNVTPSVPSLSYGDSCVPDVAQPNCSMDLMCVDDDMDL